MAFDRPRHARTAFELGASTRQRDAAADSAHRKRVGCAAHLVAPRFVYADCARLMDAARNGACHAVGRHRADTRDGQRLRIGKRLNAPVESANTTSPSNGANTGRMARARPALAICATRLASAGVSAASVATHGEVVLARGCGIEFRARPIFSVNADACIRLHAAELVVDLERPRPERARAGHRCRAKAVHARQRRHRVAVSARRSRRCPVRL